MKVSHLLRCAAFGAAILSNVTFADEIGASLDCHFGPHDFIEQLAEKKEIDPVPMKVSDDSVNAYQLKPNQNMTALGFKVRAVFGFAPNDDMFSQKNGSGQTPTQVYGVVVVAGGDAVSERLREMGSPAKVKEVVPLMVTAVICQKP